MKKACIKHSQLRMSPESDNSNLAIEKMKKKYDF